ncbi:MAG: endolytic transglycosylase MltG [Candidatus Afipia apatlaquensis]|uniref:Endolytic murein transglycosylase n=1 Tax=Candidatus Afipia apatlaquensis TaxID=2712852 RepID=A0A7C9VHV1_9BRAD|nr:endolytic transglycosylase MltG [Candidatus Afipia apatlaquensis]
MSQRPPIAPRSPRAALEPEQVPQPPKHSQRARSTLVVVGNAIFTFLIIAMLIAGGVFFYGKKTIEAKGPLTEDKVVNIPPRAGMTDIGDILQRAGVITADRWTFIGSVLAMNARSGLKSGEYLFQKNASLRDVINTIVEGKVVQHAITIPEGLTSEQIVARLQDNDIFSGSLKEQPREGTLLPDTYNFPRGTPRDQVIHRMQQAQKKVLAEVWARRNPDSPVRTPEQLVTLASIVEKETGRADERSRVAAVFTNRLRQRIKLQSDPTIIYGLVGGKGTLGRPIKRSEITQPSPYNTYVIEGLPPGPIANPGRASLEATANPARTRDLFFVADGTGGHSFTETYDQHQKGVAKLRAMERQQQNDTVDADDQPPVSAVPAPATGAPAAAAPAKPPANAAPKAAPKAAAPRASAPASIIAAEPPADGAAPAARKRTAKRTPAAAPAEPEPEEEKTQ